ncbi:hypothetical protein PENTCL1PPCAC_21138, partial [Pristionchus entomophagus]
PSHFSSSQRQYVQDACFSAGIEVLQLLNSTSAAALALCSRRLAATTGKPVRRSPFRTMLVCNLGATIEVATITVEIASRLKVKAVAADKNNGGDHFTRLLVDHFVDELKADHDKDISTDPAALNLLRIACVRAKKTISNYSQAPIELKELGFYSTITRAKFEKICAPSFRATLDLVQTAVRPSPEEIEVDEIVLVGGSSRVPMLQKMLLDAFPNQEHTN